MHRFSWLAMLAAGSALGVAAHAGDKKGEVKPQHGGSVSSTDAYRFEVVFERGGLKVYPLTRDGKPIDAQGIDAVPTVKFGDVAESLRSSLWQGAMVSDHLRIGNPAFIVLEKVERVSCSRH